MDNDLIKCCNNNLKPFWRRKLFFTVVFSAIFVLLYSIPVLAQPNSDWIHGNYSANTDTCGTCHSTHNASSRYLTTFTTNGPTSDIYQNCTFCHSALGSSKYDEVDGMFKGNGVDSNGNAVEPKSGCTAGGGFEKMPAAIKDYTSSGPEYSYTPVTSNHLVNQPSGTLVNIPGGTLLGSNQMELTCTSCHNVHGKTDNSLLLKVRLDIWDDVENDYKSVDIPKVVKDSSSAFNNAITDFCLACHTDYSTGPGQYRHPVAKDGSNPQVLASSASGFNPDLLALPVSSSGEVTCLTCHNAHGTTAQVSNSAYNPSPPVRPSTLLRMDERGVCENCHNKTPDKTQPNIDTAKSFETSDLKHIVLTFSNYVSKKTAETLTNYAISVEDDSGAAIVKAELLPNAFLSKQVLLTLNNSINLGKNVNITVNNIMDLSGNTISAAGNQFSFQGK